MTVLLYIGGPVTTLVTVRGVISISRLGLFQQGEVEINDTVYRQVLKLEVLL